MAPYVILKKMEWGATRKMHTKIVVLFNHKGGVSKTTNTYHVGWKLTQLGKRVLLVDGDPQCNLTSLLLGDRFDDYYTDTATAQKNIKDAVKMAFEGKPRPITAIDCYSPQDNPNLFIIPGHMDLSEFDPALSLALNSNNAITTLQNLPGSFYELIRLCSERYAIDYVLIDMNPGLSAINQTFFMISDGFIVPTNPDPFSVMALKTLKSVLPRWKKWAAQSREAFIDSAYPLPEVEMKFVGEIIQRFNLRNQRAARPYQGKIQEIKDYIETELCPEFEKNNMLFDNTDLIAGGVLTDHCLAEISEFGALIQKANAISVPVFALTPEQLEARGTVLDNMIVSQERFNIEFERIAKVILELVQ